MVKYLLVLFAMVATSSAASAARFEGLVDCATKPEVEQNVDEAIVDFAKSNHGARMYKLPVVDADSRAVGFIPYYYESSQKVWNLSSLYLCTDSSKDYFYVDDAASQPKKWLKQRPAGATPQAWLKKHAALRKAPENDPGLSMINDDESLVQVLNIPRGETAQGEKIVEVYFSVYDLAEDKTANQGVFFLILPKALLK
jgi:hypothetical protein